MAGVFSAVFGPVGRRLTYRRWTYLVLGATLIVPFTLAAVAIVPPVLRLLLPADTAEQPLVLAATMVLAIIAWAAGTSFIPAVRVVEGTAARELLGAGVPAQASARATNLEARWKTCQWFLVHILIGAVIGGFTLYVPIGLLQSFAAPFTGEWLVIDDTHVRVPTGWQSAWIPVVSVVATVVLVHVVNLAGVGLTRLSQVLLGPTPADHLAELKQRAERLAERNRLARELHDSVGHALSVVTIQASAAGRVLEKDPTFAQRALTAIEEAARDALADLDHVLGLLREDEPGTKPQHTLADLDELLGTMRLAGVNVETRITGDLPGLPFAVSTEAYRIVQECLTNALKHAGKVTVTLAVKAGHDALEVDAVNPLTGQARTGGGGRGIAGMRERATVLRGQINAGPQDGAWRVKARIPL
ncbi:histidine kinase [Kibdelosporangium persicum]|uniref:histidine kinase n=1 Tax=Kibdelosporangium persicum TaxID=2698649 RepID=A0ABX2F865_9PSEU|nr:histidine kinase [Kibdelosporangium persicum]NRN67540.1 Integral membrane sensor signal transduction histidine kinase [Kibdelosporangium persicum]